MINQAVSTRPIRTIRSYGCRRGRLAAAHHQILLDYWQIYGIGNNSYLNRLRTNTPNHNLNYLNKDFNKDYGFARHAPLILEIGFGDGEALLALARATPNKNFLGVEVFTLGIAKVLAALHTEQLSNVKLVATDAVEFLQHHIQDNSLSAVNLFFPDPWPKARHHKRRLVQDEFVALLAKKLALGGKFYLATDWVDYAQQMLTVLENSSTFNNVYGRDNFAPRCAGRKITKYEAKAIKAGRDIWDLCFQRCS